jgi:hypothetical protein
MATNKTEAIAKFILTGKICCFGNLRCVGDAIYTYDVLLAKVDRTFRDVYLNTDRYSVTSTRHRNLVEAAATSTYLPTGWTLDKVLPEDLENL